jgi:poly(3-hydroxyoctanoate) depolymerase
MFSGQIEFRHIEPPVDLVAHSMGCVVALMLTLRRPEVVKRLVLGGASGGIDISPFETQEWRAAYERELPAEAPRWFMDEEPNLETELPKIEQPVLLVWGGDDRIVPPAVGKRFTELLPNARLAIITGGTHAVAREQPGEVARHIRAFLGE